jgi:hypothetical protein
VYWLVIDGRRHASVGATGQEVGEWLLHFGAYNGLNMDGGGSSTMVLWDEKAKKDKAILVNNPVGSGVDWLELPGLVEKLTYGPTERKVGNNLGVVLLPEE